MIINVTVYETTGDLMKGFQNLITTNQDLTGQGQDAGLQFLKETNLHTHTSVLRTNFIYLEQNTADTYLCMLCIHDMLTV